MYVVFLIMKIVPGIECRKMGHLLNIKIARAARSACALDRAHIFLSLKAVAFNKFILKAIKVLCPSPGSAMNF